MKEIVLSGATWQTVDDFYDAFFAAVGAPSWHGRNFNALNDSIGTGDINKVAVPYSLKITGLKRMSGAARSVVEKFRTLIGELQTEGVPVSLTSED
jgi:hypothetical protein